MAAAGLLGLELVYHAVSISQLHFSQSCPSVLVKVPLFCVPVLLVKVVQVGVAVDLGVVEEVGVPPVHEGLLHGELAKISQSTPFDSSRQFYYRLDSL